MSPLPLRHSFERAAHQHGIISSSSYARDVSHSHSPAFGTEGSWILDSGTGPKSSRDVCIVSTYISIIHFGSSPFSRSVGPYKQLVLLFPIAIVYLWFHSMFSRCVHVTAIIAMMGFVDMFSLDESGAVDCPTTTIPANLSDKRQNTAFSVIYILTRGTT